MDAMQGGDLYQLQREAILRARETAKKAMPCEEASKVDTVSPKRPLFSSENMVIIAVLVLLLLNGCDDMMLIVALALVLII